MVVSTDYANLSEELQKALADYSTAISEGLNDAYKELAEAGVAELQQGRPYHNRTGQYAKNFAVTQRKNAASETGSESYTIYNKKHYQITHLLEHGHLTRKGGRAAAFEHWKPTLEMLERETEGVIRGVIGKVSD